MMKKSILALAFLAMTMSVAVAQARTIKIIGENSLQFSKTTITAKPGEKLTVKLVNNTKMPPSAMSHNWILLASGADAEKVDSAGRKAGQDNDYIPQNMSDEIIAHTSLVSGGHSDSVTFTVPKKPGEYEYICSFPGHFAAGMKGTLKVKGD